MVIYMTKNLEIGAEKYTSIPNFTMTAISRNNDCGMIIREQ